MDIYSEEQLRQRISETIAEFGLRMATWDIRSGMNSPSKWLDSEVYVIAKSWGSTQYRQGVNAEKKANEAKALKDTNNERN